jgi:hypothetical protein
MKDEALKLALEALESCGEGHITDGGTQWHDAKLIDKAITAIKQALAAPVQPQHISPKQLLSLAQEANLGLDKVIEVFRMAAQPAPAPMAHIVGEIDHSGKVWTPAQPAPVQKPYGYWWIPDGSVPNLKPDLSQNTGPHPNFTVIPLYTTPPAQPAPCTWTKSNDPNMPDTFNASCGVVWTFTDGGHGENNVRFCPGCGGKLVEGQP